MVHRLVVKLSLAFIVVSLIGIGLVASLIALRTESAFDQFVWDRNQGMLATSLAQYYQANHNWKGVESLLPPDSAGPGAPPRPYRLVNAQGKVITGVRGPSDDRIPQSELKRQGVPIEVDGKVVGWLMPNQSPRYREWGELERLFLTRVNQAILLSVLGAMLAALLLGLLLARTLSHPLRELTEATRALARGELGRQVSVRSRDEVGELATAFNQMSRDLARAGQLRRQMMADIAHELRTPLSMILGYAEGLSDGKLQARPETFEIIYDETQRLSRLVDDLRTLSLADAGELPLMRRPVAPQALLEHTALVYMTAAEGQNVSLQIESEPDLPEIDVDRDRLIQVLSNLVGNALRYTPSGGQITLAAGQNGDGVWLRVQDNGMGIPSQDLPHIFDRFYRVDKSRNRQSGESGLGLAIARSIVEMHGGNITAESQPGQGACFNLALPVTA